ncbi:BTAD domain-containing putative transcriptional regulator [Anderseniella sp. Alg231-50]|uniref:BTAD domain-containing putative transcriptional regulator n=1 Tax=Anderseniella sp. Alg231-50 TaxID=1922226 RepID=UPI00307C5B12
MEQINRKVREPIYMVSAFGYPHASVDGRAISVPEKLPIALAVLASQPDRMLSQRHLVSMLWGNADRAKANASFRQFLVKVRKLEKQYGGGLLVKSGKLVSYDCATVQVDLEKVLANDIVEDARNGNYSRLAAFVGTLGSPLLQGAGIDTHEFEDWYYELTNKLLNAKTAALSALMDHETEPSQVENIANALLQLDPSNEAAYRALMKLWCELGNHTKALKVYNDCCQVLLTDYGIKPSLSTEQLATTMGIKDPASSPVLAPFTAAGNARGGEPGNQPGQVEQTQRIGAPRMILLPPRMVIGADPSVQLIEALLDDITAGLTRYRSIAVLAAHSGRMASQDSNRDFDAIGKRFGVDYILSTIVTADDAGPTATFLLLDAHTSESLMALDKRLSEDQLPKLFSRLSFEIVRQLVSTIERREIATPKTTDNSSAYRYFLNGRRLMWHSDLPEIRKARNSFRRSMNEAENFAPAYSGLSRTLSMERLVRGMSSSDLLIESLEFANKSIRLDPMDGRGLRELGFTNLYLRRHDQSLENFAAAADLTPNDADMLADYADALSHAGQGAEALAICLQAKASNPDPPAYYDWIHASILYQLSAYRAAITILKPHRKNPGIARLLAASYAMSGDLDTASQYGTTVRENYPSFELSRLSELVPDKNANDTRHLIEGLRMAGLS